MRDHVCIVARLASVLGVHGKCVCELCEASCSPATLVRLLQYYSSWAQLRDALIANWRPLGEEEAGVRSPLVSEFISSSFLFGLNLALFLSYFSGVVAVVVSDDCSLGPLYGKVLPALAMGKTLILW